MFDVEYLSPRFRGLRILMRLIPTACAVGYLLPTTAVADARKFLYRTDVIIDVGRKLGRGFITLRELRSELIFIFALEFRVFNCEWCDG